MNIDYNNEKDILCFNTIEDCIKFVVLNNKNYEEFWIIGGETIYKEILLNYQEFINEIHMSKLHSSFSCDKFIDIPFDKYKMINNVKYKDFDYIIYKTKS